MKLTIRTADIYDAELLSEMGYASYRAHFEHLWQSWAELEDYLQDQYAVSVIENSLTDSAYHWMIAATDKPVGFTKLIWQSLIPEENISGALLSKIYLLPDQIGKKYGEALLKAAI